MQYTRYIKAVNVSFFLAASLIIGVLTDAKSVNLQLNQVEIYLPQEKEKKFPIFPI